MFLQEFCSLSDGIIKNYRLFFHEIFTVWLFNLTLASEFLMIAVGILILVRREAILRLIFVIFGLVILTDALLRIQMSVEAKKFGLKLWWAVFAYCSSNRNIWNASSC